MNHLQYDLKALGVPEKDEMNTSSNTIYLKLTVQMPAIMFLAVVIFQEKNVRSHCGTHCVNKIWENCCATRPTQAAGLRKLTSFKVFSLRVKISHFPITKFIFPHTSV